MGHVNNDSNDDSLIESSSQFKKIQFSWYKIKILFSWYSASWPKSGPKIWKKTFFIFLVLDFLGGPGKKHFSWPYQENTRRCTRKSVPRWMKPRVLTASFDRPRILTAQIRVVLTMTAEKGWKKQKWLRQKSKPNGQLLIIGQLWN